MIEGFDEFPVDSFQGAVLKGREDTLRHLQMSLAKRLDDFSEDGDERMYVALAKQLADVSRELSELGADAVVSELDRARADRRARRSA